MPELGFFSRRGGGATLDISYMEAAIADEVILADIGETLEEMHDVPVLGIQTDHFIGALEADHRCERIVSFLKLHRANAEANGPDRGAVWSAIGFES